MFRVNAAEAAQDGRIHIEKINAPFLKGGGSPAGYGAGLKLRHPPGMAFETRVRDLREVHAGRCGAIRVDLLRRSFHAMQRASSVHR